MHLPMSFRQRWSRSRCRRARAAMVLTAEVRARRAATEKAVSVVVEIGKDTDVVAGRSEARSAAAVAVSAVVAIVRLVLQSLPSEQMCLLVCDPDEPLVACL